MKLDELQAELADFLNQRGVQAMASWQPGRRTDGDSPVVLVSLDKLDCGPAAMQDYLGQELDEESGMWQELYGRRAKVTFVLDVLARPGVGMQACRSTLDELLRVLQREKPVGLSVSELKGEEPEYDEKEGLLRLRCRLACSGWLYALGDGADTFLDFTLKGDVNT